MSSDRHVLAVLNRMILICEHVEFECSVQEEKEKLTFGLYLRFWKF